MKKLLKYLTYFILALAVFFFGFALLMPTVFSTQLAIVRSSSMEPAMPAGALALMVPVDPEKVKVGDIIAFEPPWDPDVTVSHRVIDIRSNGGLIFDTKGDAVEESDPYWVPADFVQGKVIFNVPYLGFAVNQGLVYVSSWWGFALAVGLPSTILIGNTIREVNRSGSVRARRLKNLQERRRRAHR